MARTPRPAPGIVRHVSQGHTFDVTVATDRRLRSEPPYASFEAYLARRAKLAGVGCLANPAPEAEGRAWHALHCSLYNRPPPGTFDGDWGEDEGPS